MNSLQLRELLANNATPLYVFDLAELHRRVWALRQVLPGHVELCYAVKANTFILRQISQLVDRLEICSPGELHICQNLQLPSEKFVISGVYKEPALMGQLISQDGPMSIYTVESQAQFSSIYRGAVTAHKQVPVLLRLTSGNQFGLEESEIEHIVAQYSGDPCLDIRGIQYFSGTQKTSLKRLKRELHYVDCFLKTLCEKYGYQANELEFGPGFPVSYFQGDSFDETAYLQEFSSILLEMQFSGKITLELGRSIAASCGSYLTKVVDIKCNRSENYAIVDGGIHHLVYYGQSMAMKFPHVQLLSSHKNGQEENRQDTSDPTVISDQNDALEEWNVCGALCTVNDILVKRLPLKGLQIGDVLVFENTGAYCMTEGSSLFLSRDLPGILLICQDGRLLTVRDHLQTHILNTPNSKGDYIHGKTH